MPYSEHTDDGVDGPDAIPDPAADHVSDYMSNGLHGALMELPANYSPTQLAATCTRVMAEVAKEAYWVGRADERAGRPESDE